MPCGATITHSCKQGSNASGVLLAAHYQIVAVDHLGAAAKAEDRQHVGGRAALDLVGIGRVIGDQAAPDFGAVRPAHDNRIAALESAVDLDDAGRQ